MNRSIDARSATSLRALLAPALALLATAPVLHATAALPTHVGPCGSAGPKVSPQDADDGSHADDARALLERGHFAENHEHDLARAKELFERAAQVARRAEDEPLAAEAEDALRAVRIRLGEIEGDEPAADTEHAASVVALLVRAQSLDHRSEAAPTLIADLSLYGATAVDLLERSIEVPAREPVEPDPRLASFRSNPLFAARALGTIATSRARAALRAALDSDDPQLRRAIVEWAPADQLDLFVAASDDSVDVIRDAALDRIYRRITDGSYALHDRNVVAQLAQVAERAFLAGSERFGGLLGTYRPEVALKLLARPLDETLRRSLVVTPRFDEDTPLALFEQASRIAHEDPDPLLREYTARIIDRALGDWSLRIGTEEYTAFRSMARRTLRETPSSAAAQVCTLLSFDEAVEDLRVAFDNGLVLDEALDDVLDGLFQYIRAEAPRREGRGWDRGGQVSLSSQLALIELLASNTDWSAVSPPRETLTRLLSEHVRRDDLKLDGQHLVRLLRFWNDLPENARAQLFAAADPLYPVRERLRSNHTLALEEIEAALTAASWVLDHGAVHQMRGAVSVLALSNDPAWIGRVIAACRARESATTTITDVDLRELTRQVSRAAPEATTATLLTHYDAAADGPNAIAEREALLRAGLNAVPTVRLAFVRALLERSIDEALLMQLAHVFTKVASLPAELDLLPTIYDLLPPEQIARRVEIVQRLGATLYEPGIDLIGRALGSTDKKIRDAARAALEEFRKQREAVQEFERWKRARDEARETTDALIALLDSDERDVVLGAIEALGAVRAKSALPQLVALLAQDDAELKKAVRAAIARIGAED